MPDLAHSPRRLPKYRHYKPKNLAVVRLSGHDVYLGKYNSPESREKYNRVIAEWLTTGTTRVSQDRQEAALSVNEVIYAFLTRHADLYYRHADGTPTGEVENYKDALRPLKRLYGRTLATEFGPLALLAVRSAMINSGLCRTTINARIGKIVHVFRWATENELVPAGVHQALKAVTGLRKGRSQAREAESVKPVPDTFVDAIQPHVASQVWAMIELQRLTAMRPGEVTIMRTGDLDMTGTLWEYIPKSHKTEHIGKGRRIILGPKAQAVLKPWLRTDLFAYLFSPKEAVEEQRDRVRRAGRRVLDPRGLTARGARKPGRAPGALYKTRAYTHAIHRGCRKAGVPTWGPNRLRHNAATRLRKEFGLDVARAVLGHSDAATTTIYAERDHALAASAMERVG